MKLFRLLSFVRSFIRYTFYDKGSDFVPSWVLSALYQSLCNDDVLFHPSTTHTHMCVCVLYRVSRVRYCTCVWVSECQQRIGRHRRTWAWRRTVCVCDFVSSVSIRSISFHARFFARSIAYPHGLVHTHSTYCISCLYSIGGFVCVASRHGMEAKLTPAERYCSCVASFRRLVVGRRCRCRRFRRNSCNVRQFSPGYKHKPMLHSLSKYSAGWRQRTNRVPTYVCTFAKVFSDQARILLLRRGKGRK